MHRFRLTLLAIFFSFWGFFLPPSVQAQSAGPTSCRQTNIDISEYVAPQCSGGRCPDISASAISNSVRHVGNVTNYIEWLSPTRYMQHSNEIHFLYELTGNSVKFLQDTIWDQYRCTNGKDAMYRVSYNSPNDWGADILPRQMSCGDSFRSTTVLNTFEYNPTVEITPDISLNSCTVSGQPDGTINSSQNQLFFQGTAQCNGKTNVEVIGIRNTGGAGAGEVNFYCKGFGLCAWYQSLDFSNPSLDPRQWTAQTDVCNLQPDVSDYYLYPIKGLPTNTTKGDSAAILQDLAQQGYEAHCSTPSFSVQVIEGGDIELWKSKVAGGQTSAQRRTITANEAIDYATSQVPVLRDANPLANLMASLEDFWGFQNTALTSKARLEETISSSFLYSKLTLKDQCQFKVNILQTINRMCGQLADPSTCALYQPIPNAGNYTTQSIYNDFVQSGLTCQDVALKNYNAQQQPMVHALLKTPLYLDRAYRLAFLVVVGELKEGNVVTNFFNFLRNPEATADPRDEVRVIAFKVPDIGTNRPEGDLYYQDPLQITRDIILDQNQITLNTERNRSGKQALINGGVKATGSVIDCDGTEACEDALVKALVSIVNNTGMQCNATAADLEYEPSDTIHSSGSLGETESTQFSDGTNPSSNLLSNEYKSTSNSSNQRGIFNFLSQVNIGLNGENQSKVRAYLIYPMGYELYTVEDTLMSFLTLKTGQDVAQDPNLKNYFKINGVNQSLTSSKTDVSFQHLETPCVPNPDDPDKPCTSNKQATAELGSDQADAATRILGGKLGFLTRLVQQTVNKIESGQLAYLRSCKTTEDFLLNRCSGINPSDTNQPETPNEYLATEVVSTNNCRSVPRIGAGLDIDRDLPAGRFGPTCNSLGLKTTADQANLPALKYENSLNISDWRNSEDGDIASLCNETFYQRVACTNGPGRTADGLTRQGSGPALIAHKVDASGNFSPSGQMTACEYVVTQAKQNGVSPRLALAMWAEESGFSAVSNNGDFGVISRPTVRESNSLREQVAGFIGTIKDRRYTTYLSFLLNYSGEGNKSELPPVYFCNNRAFPDRLKDLYNQI